MRKLGKTDWLLFALAAPLGGVMGCLALGLATMALFALIGRGSSHADAFDLYFAILIGGFCGFFAGPVAVWRRWRRQSSF